MTPEEIKKEQEKSNLQQMQTKTDAQVDKPVISASLTDPATNKTDITPPKESTRQYSKKVGDYKTIQREAASRGINLDDIGEMPLLDSDKGKITDAVKSLYPKEIAEGISNLSKAYAAPQNEERNKLDQKALMDSARRERRARWADALYAFGEGLQGKTANPENFASTRIQRKRDKEFQDFKDVTERNQKTKFLWETQYRKDAIAWAEEQARNQRLDEQTRLKFQQLADQFNKGMEFKEKQLKQTKDIADDRNKTAVKVAGIRAAEDKDKKKVTVQTAKNTYELAPEEAEYFKGEVLKNADSYRSKYPGLFEKVQEPDELDMSTGNTVKGRVYYRLNPRLKDVDLIRVYLEENKEGFPQFEKSKNNIMNQYKMRGEIDENQPIKPTQQKLKADPLGLGL